VWPSFKKKKKNKDCLRWFGDLRKTLRLCLRVWRGREGRALKKKEETSGRNREVWEGRSLEGYFFFITQKPLNLGELKNCIE
jgi:hypothetical protein